ALAPRPGPGGPGLRWDPLRPPRPVPGGGEQAVLVAEVVREQRDVEAGPERDRAHRRAAEPLGRELLACGLKNPCPVVAVAPGWSARALTGTHASRVPEHHRQLTSSPVDIINR